MRFKDISNQRFGRLTAIVAAGKNKQGILWKCRCDCGNEIIALGKQLTSMGIRSCGCLKREILISRNSKRQHKKHDHTWCFNGIKFRSRTYITWENMIKRCTNPKATHYDCYGGRGIKVCDEWRDFRNFLRDMGERPEGLTLDRKDNNKGYYKKNCRWATRKEQTVNRRNVRKERIKCTQP